MATQEATFPGQAVRLSLAEDGPLETDDLLRLWRRMTAIRIHEEVVERLNGEGLIRGSTHLYIGMEACAVGVVSATTPLDLAIGYFRSHGHALALGVPARSVIAEILARTAGCCGGRGGTKHLLDVERNYLGAYAIVGQQVSMATGLAFALKLAVAAGRREPSLAACFFGDGGANQGTTLEALNLAAVYSLPCVFVCENNQYAVSSPARVMVGGGSIAGRARGFGLEVEEVDGMDVLAVRAAMLRARRHALAGQPVFLELLTYRYRGHSVFQIEDRYRDADEVRSWQERDPIRRLEGELAARGVEAAELEAERREILEALEADAEWAKEQPPLESVTESDMLADRVRGLDEWGGAA